jgi:protein AbiQ
LDYLREKEPRIPNKNYGGNKFKPFFKPLFISNGLIYVSQVSHPQSKHDKMLERSTFVKLTTNGRLIGVVNLNYMFPVPLSEIKNIDFSNIDKYRTFKNKQEKSKYFDLLKLELREINKKNVDQKAVTLYNLVIKDASLSRICLPFETLEQLGKQYIKDKHIDKKLEKELIDNMENSLQKVKQTKKNEIDTLITKISELNNALSLIKQDRDDYIEKIAELFENIEILTAKKDKE